jgi:hypothetical protein
LHDGTPPSAPFAGYFTQNRDIPLTIDFAPRDGPGLYLTEACGLLCPGTTRVTDLHARWASTVLAYRATDVAESATISDALGSRNSWSVSLPPGTQNGSALVRFGWLTASAEPVTGSATTVRIDDGTTATETVRLHGLPVLGFMVRTFRNGTLRCSGAACQGNYGGSFPHKYLRELQ